MLDGGGRLLCLDERRGLRLLSGEQLLLALIRLAAVDDEDRPDGGGNPADDGEHQDDGEEALEGLASTEEGDGREEDGEKVEHVRSRSGLSRLGGEYSALL